VREIKSHINQISALVIGLLCVLVLHLSGLVTLFAESPMSYKQSLDFEENVRVETDANGTQSVEVIHPNLSLMYSTNGGDECLNAGTILDLETVTNNNLIQQPYAWKSKAADWNLPAHHSVSCFLINPKTKERSDMIQFERSSGFIAQLPQLSIHLSQTDFNSESAGLYAMGCNSWSMEKFNEAWWYRKANFNQRGSEWEKQVHFLFEDETITIRQKGGLKVSGNATRGFPQKSFKLYARKQYGSTEINGGILHQDFDYQSLVLRTSGNDNTKTLFADLLMHQLAEKRLLTQNGKAVHLFINGNYWGIYNIRERISIENLALRFDKKIDKITLLEDGAAELKDGDPEQKQKFDDLIAKVEEMDKVDAKLYTKIQDKIDIQSLCNYIFFETYFANNDWPNNNSICYKIKKEKWQWMMNDLDYSLAYPGADNVNKNMFDHLKNRQAKVAILFNKLLTNKEFKSTFKAICEKRMEDDLSDQRMQDCFDGLKNKLEQDIDFHIGRWRAFNREEWEMNCQANLDFLLQRKAIYKQHLEAL